MKSYYANISSTKKRSPFPTTNMFDFFLENYTQMKHMIFNYYMYIAFSGSVHVYCALLVFRYEWKLFFCIRIGFAFTIYRYYCTKENNIFQQEYAIFIQISKSIVFHIYPEHYTENNVSRSLLVWSLYCNPTLQQHNKIAVPCSVVLHKRKIKLKYSEVE